MIHLSRRDLLSAAASAAAGLVPLGRLLAADAPASGSLASSGKITLGLVTYMWGAKWDLPTLIANCEKTRLVGVELRRDHAHGVGLDFTAAQRKEVKKRFADSAVKLLGFGANTRYDSPDPEKLKASIEETKRWVQLSHDCGGSGVKVQPNDLPKDVPHEKTLEQIGRSLNALGRYAADLGQQIRLEVHGQCAPLPITRKIIDIADDKNVVLCWNSNRDDLQGDGLEYNFNLVKHRLGPTMHVHEMDSKQYPFADLLRLLAKNGYAGCLLLECTSPHEDLVAEIDRQRGLFEAMLDAARKK